MVASIWAVVDRLRSLPEAAVLQVSLWDDQHELLASNRWPASGRAIGTDHIARVRSLVASAPRAAYAIVEAHRACASDPCLDTVTI